METTKQEQTVGRQYNSIDLCKFIMAFAVVAIHTKPFINCENAVFMKIYGMFVGLAVPFFFLASGYLLAVKMDYPYGSERDLLRLKRQLRIITRMYLTWTLIYAPLAIYYFVSTRKTVIQAVLIYVRGFVFIGEQYNSWQLWYLLSTIYALIVIGYILKMKRTPHMLAVISAVASLLSVGCTEFVRYDGNLSPILAAFQMLIDYSIANGSIFLGLVYIPVGMLLAHRTIPRYINWLGFAVAFILNYFVENSVLSSYLQIMTAIALFGAVEGISLKNNPVFLRLRTMSTVIYLTHMYIWSFYYKFVYGEKTYGMDSFVITSCVAIAISAVYMAVEKKGLMKRSGRISGSV